MDMWWIVKAAISVVAVVIVYRYLLGIARRIDAHIDDHNALKSRVAELEATVDDLTAAQRRDRN